MYLGFYFEELFFDGAICVGWVEWFVYRHAFFLGGDHCDDIEVGFEFEVVDVFEVLFQMWLYFGGVLCFCEDF